MIMMPHELGATTVPGCSDSRDLLRIWDGLRSRRAKSAAIAQNPAMTTDLLTATREAWHQIAEHVVAAAQYAESGRIELRSIDGGFETTQPAASGRRLAVIGTELVISEGDDHRSCPLTTVAAAAMFAGVTPGMPPEVYPPATPLRPDDALTLDPASAQQLAAWYQLADAALRRFGSEVGAPGGEPILWPEHFDIGITIEQVNYGASPGDEHIDEPYFYVGPHLGPPTRDDFWNAPFGAARTRAQIADVDDAVDFMRAGRLRVTPE
jgi:hypothetical protein